MTTLLTAGATGGTVPDRRHDAGTGAMVDQLPGVPGAGVRV